MPESRIHFRTVVVFPSDVKAEKSLLPKIIDKINKDSANPLGLHIDLWAWDTDANPTFNALGPQGSIDEDIEIESCDLLIGIFWHRLGTPTQDGMTGTEHELHLAYQVWLNRRKPEIMVYFLQADYLPKTAEECKQLECLLRFKAEFARDHRLSWECKNRRHFEHEVERHIRKFIIRKASTLFTHQDFGGWSDVQTVPMRKETIELTENPELDGVLRDRVQSLLKKAELAEIRSTFGETLGVMFLTPLAAEDDDAEKKADHLAYTCGLNEKRRARLLKVAKDALNYLKERQVW